MRIFILFISLLFVRCSNTSQVSSSKEKTVTIHVDQVLQHCGGMRPPKDYVNGYKTTSFKNATFYIKTGDKNSAEEKVVSTFTTDENGNAKVNLPNGSYCIVLAAKNDAYTNFYEKITNVDEYTTFDDECIRDWYLKCDASLKVKESKTFSFQIHHNCGYGFNPCLKYTGPPQP